jgi:hypothetical protein
VVRHGGFYLQPAKNNEFHSGFGRNEITAGKPPAKGCSAL